MTMRNLLPATGQVIEAMREQFVTTDDAPLGGKVDTIEHRPGTDVALDGLFIGDCPGLAWVNVIRLYRTADFPTESDRLAPCSGVPVAVIQAGVARCVATVDAQGYPPTAEDMEHDALVGLDDAARLERALCVAARRAMDLDVVDAAVWSATEPIGPQGGVLAWVATLTVQLT